MRRLVSRRGRCGGRAGIAGNDLGVVDHDGVTGAQKLRQIADGAVLELRHLPGPHHQKPRGVARRRRPQRDAILRQHEIEQIGAHGFG